MTMSWWQRLWRRGQMEEQLDKELQFHLEQHVSELIARGVEPAEARRQARLALGGPEQVKEQCRDERGTRWLEDLVVDMRYALRMLRKNPGFTTVALLTLALGIGATTVMFTVVNGVLLKPVPFPEPDKLVAVHGHSETWNTAAFGEQNVAYPDFLDCKRESRSIDMAAALFNGGTLSEPGEPEYVDLREISYDLFSVLHVNLAQGRAFLPEEDIVGGAPAMILGYSFWQRHFAGKPDVIGTSVVLDQKRYTVVGIAPANFQLYEQEADVYTPLGQDTAGYLRNRASSSGSRAGAAAIRRDSGTSSDGSGARRQTSGRAIRGHKWRPHPHRATASAGRGKCTIDTVAAAWRGQPGAADCVRERGELAAGARRFAGA